MLSGRNSATTRTGRGSAGTASFGSGRGASGLTRRGLLWRRKSTARSSCFFLYAFRCAAEQNSSSCSLRRALIFFPQWRHSMPSVSSNVRRVERSR